MDDNTTTGVEEVTNNYYWLSEKNSVSSLDPYNNVDDESTIILNSTNYTLCDTYLKNLLPYSYSDVDTYVASILCLCGVVTNIVNIIVFRRRSMRRSSTNIILTSLAVADLLFALRKLQRTLLTQFYGAKFVNYRKWRFKSRQHAMVHIIDIIGFMLFHTWAIYLTLLLALWRYTGILYPLKSLPWLTIKRVKWAIGLTLIFSTIMVITMCLGMHLRLLPNSNLTVPIPPPQTQLDLNDQLDDEDSYIYEWAQEKYGTILLVFVHLVFIKMGPCIVLSVVTLGLVCSLSRSRRNRRKLSEFQGTSSASELNVVQNKNGGGGGGGGGGENSTNKILLIVLLIFIVTEAPAGIMTTMWMIFGREFLVRCLIPIVPLTALAEYVSSTTSIIVYFLMSKNYRNNFKSAFRLSQNGETTTDATTTNRQSSEFSTTGVSNRSRHSTTTTVADLEEMSPNCNQIF